MLRLPWLAALLCTIPWCYIAYQFWTDGVGKVYTPGQEARFFALVFLLAGACMAGLVYLILLPRKGSGPRIGALAGTCCAWPFAFFGAVVGFMLMLLIGVNAPEEQRLRAKWVYTWCVIASLAVPQIVLVLLGSMVGALFKRRAEEAG